MLEFNTHGRLFVSNIFRYNLKLSHSTSCVYDFPREEVSVKIVVMKFGFKYGRLKIVGRPN